MMVTNSLRREVFPPGVVCKSFGCRKM